MPTFPPPRSSVPTGRPRSSMPPSQTAGFVKTLEGLRAGFARLGVGLARAGAGIFANLLGPLSALRSSARDGDEDAEKAYQEALALLRNSGSDAAGVLLKELGEEEAGGTASDPDVSPSAGSDVEASAGVEVPPAPPAPHHAAQREEPLDATTKRGARKKRSSVGGRAKDVATAGSGGGERTGAGSRQRDRKASAASRRAGRAGVGIETGRR